MIILKNASLLPCSEIFKHIGHADQKSPQAHCKTDPGLWIEHAGKDYRKGGSENGSQNKNVKTCQNMAFQC